MVKSLFKSSRRKINEILNDLICLSWFAFSEKYNNQDVSAELNEWIDDRAAMNKISRYVIANQGHYLPEKIMIFSQVLGLDTHKVLYSSQWEKAYNHLPTSCYLMGFLVAMRTFHLAAVTRPSLKVRTEDATQKLQSPDAVDVHDEEQVLLREDPFYRRYLVFLGLLSVDRACISDDERYEEIYRSYPELLLSCERQSETIERLCKDQMIDRLPVERSANDGNYSSLSSLLLFSDNQKNHHRHGNGLANAAGG